MSVIQFLPKMSVSNGEDILLKQLHRSIVADNSPVQLGVVGLGQGDDLDGAVLHLHLELGVLLGHDGKLDADVAALRSAK